MQPSSLASVKGAPETLVRSPEENQQEHAAAGSSNSTQNVTTQTAAVSGAIVGPFETRTTNTPSSRIDELVFGRLEKLGIQPANVCSDAVFVRRAYLDVIGTLPTAQEAEKFLQDKDPDKRQVLIERLLERDEFADYWAMKWSDVLRVKAEFPINLWPNAAQAYHHWIRTSIKENMPYDRFVREMLTASGSNFRVGQVNFYRAMQSKDPQGIAQTVALTFMGARAENWPKKRLAGMAAFFSQVGYKATAEWKEEIVYFDPGKATQQHAGRAAMLSRRNPDQTYARPGSARGLRRLADHAKNPWFTRNIVNRVWSWLMGRGIIHEPDDIRPDNPPSNPELLAYLEQELVASHYDLKHIYRLILKSKTYQLSSIPRSDKPEGEANFAYYPLRRLDAEVLIDAINQITGTTEQYSSAIPEPFTFIPEEQRVDCVAGRQHLQFLPRTVRPSVARHRAGIGAQQSPHGRATVAPAEFEPYPAEAGAEPEATRPLLAMQGQPRARSATELYLTILSRFPTERRIEDRGRVFPVRQAERSATAAMDLAWALINSAEFLYRH